ncbi:hypothetical protein [Celerinatantimonas sp. YJH-8]|uniref:hypothetical protein n=1 Tax=Celerinatantimonas sp. YJH-8 TaxID=3228714 RepID=UPI0038C3AE05
MKNPIHQRGVAAIVFVIIFPFFFGFFVLAIEGTRYLTDSARLSDVAESASLAVAAAVDHSDDKTRVQNYIAATIPDANIDAKNITITSKTCQQIYGSQCGIAGVYDKEGLQFNEYNVKIQSSFLSWFPGSDLIAGFDANQNLTNNAVARKYQQKFVDVAFVTDMSGSMLDGFGEQNKAKYAGVIDIIENILDTLASYNALAERSNRTERNSIAIVPYSNYNKTIDNQTIRDRSFTYSRYNNPRIYERDNLNSIYPSFTADDFNADNINLHRDYPNGIPTLGSAVPDKQRLQYYLHWSLGERSGSRQVCSGGWWNYHCEYQPYSYDTWPYDQWSVNSNDYSWWIQNYPDEYNRNLKIRNYIGCSNYTSRTDWRNNCTSIAQNGDAPGYTGYSYTIDLTDNFSTIKTDIENFFPSGGTASSQGVIPAAQLLLNKKSSNTDNLIIVLSDGKDTDSVSRNYYDAGLCDYLRQQFTNKGQTLKIAVIGFDYNPQENPGLAECTDSNSIIEAKDYSAIYNSILSLITEEIGHLYEHNYSTD